MLLEVVDDVDKAREVVTTDDDEVDVVVGVLVVGVVVADVVVGVVEIDNTEEMTFGIDKTGVVVVAAVSFTGVAVVFATEFAVVDG